jgi:hypothetical protein
MRVAAYHTRGRVRRSRRAVLAKEVAEPRAVAEVLDLGAERPGDMRAA